MANPLSVLIITYNRAADLLALLENIGMQKHLDGVLEEILLLNNASTDDYSAIETFVKANPQLKINYINNDENLGVAKGRNKLMQIARGDVLLVIDDDILFTKDNDIQKLAGTFEKPFFKEANTAAVTCRVLYYDTKEPQITAFPHKQYEKYSTKPMFLTYYYSGCAHLLKRAVLAETGIYPTDFHYGMEEYDLSYRILDAGYTIGYDNSVTVEHKESPLGRQPNYKKLHMQWVNKSKVAWRYLPFQYFVTTAVAWSGQYAKLAKGHWGTFFASWIDIIKIPFSEKRKTVSKKTLDYLRKVEARLQF